MMMTSDELRIIALKVVSDNQCDYNTEDNNGVLNYRLGYNDGVLDLLDAILEQKGEKTL